jgi:hypothetical protein
MLRFVSARIYLFRVKRSLEGVDERGIGGGELLLVDSKGKVVGELSELNGSDIADVSS